MKVSVIGGGGRVGSNALFALQLAGIVKELAVIDVNLDMAAGEALDLRHGAAYVASQKITSGGIEEAAGSDIVVITAGLRRKPDESRLDLINRNVGLFRGIIQDLKKVIDQNTIILVVSNPVDILTYLAVKESGLPANQVFGLGTTLDTLRFRSFLAEYFSVSAADVKALVLGEHGDSMIAAWSSATINGVAISSFPGYDKAKMDEIFDRTKKSGAEMIKLKGGAGYGVGVAIAEVVHAIALDKQAVLPVSSLMSGQCGMSDVCISLPTIVGRKGVEGVIEPQMSEDEAAGLKASGDALKAMLSQVSF
ncbi:MAG: L-lactate dehydrogenase [Armatimonadota bacterium]